MIDRRGFIVGTMTTTAAAALPASAAQPIEAVREIDRQLMAELDQAESTIAQARQSLSLAGVSVSERVRGDFLFDMRCKVDHASNCLDWSRTVALKQRRENRNARGMDDDDPLRGQSIGRWIPAAKALLNGGISYGDTVDILWPDLDDYARQEKLALLRRCERAGWAV